MPFPRRERSAGRRASPGAGSPDLAVRHRRLRAGAADVAPALSLTPGRLGVGCRRRRRALLLGRRLLGAWRRWAARRLSRLGRAGAGLVAGHRRLVASHRGLGGTLPRLHSFLLNGASGNRRQVAGPICIRVVSFLLRCGRCLQLLQLACLVSGRSVAAGAWQRSRQADLEREEVMQAIRDQ
jgi:hypothetical protein